MAKKSIKNINDKLSKVGEVVNVYMYDNGYMVEISGRDKEDSWATVKLTCATIEEALEMVRTASDMERE